VLGWLLFATVAGSLMLPFVNDQLLRINLQKFNILATHVNRHDVWPETADETHAHAILTKLCRQPISRQIYPTIVSFDLKEPPSKGL
jgi:hypothetical protein